MKILSYLSFVGIGLLAITNLLNIRKNTSAHFKLFLEGMFSLGMGLFSFLPLSIIHMEHLTPKSFWFYVCFLLFVSMLCWGLIIGYHITYDLLHGSTLQIVQIKEAQRIRVSIKSSEIFQLVTDDGLFLTIDFSEYSLIQHALKKDKPVTALIEYYPKAQILKKIVLEKS